MQENDIDNKVCDDDEKKAAKKQKRSYYYDDAHGYENFDPEDECDDEESED